MSKNIELPRYRCTRCRQQWVVNPGPTACPVCGELYVVWLNHPPYSGRSAEALFAALPHSDVASLRAALGIRDAA